LPSSVLILTAGYGEGHNAAARGLHAACQQLGIPSKIVDPFAAMGPAYDRSRRDYLWLINTAPQVWAAVFKLIDRLPLVEFTLPLLSDVQARLAEVLTEEQPDVVVSVYPAFSYLIGKLYPSRRPFALHTVVTDSITVNRVWHRAPSDTYIVPNAATGAVMRAQGVPAGMVHELGFPVPPKFASDRPVRPDPRKGPRVLFMVNAGKELAPAIVGRVLDLPGIHLTVTVGRDEMLREKVETAAAGRLVEILGWVPNMPDLLMTHHIMIGKAGGAAVQETIAAQTPMIITQVVPGQEEGNAQLLFDHACGALCPTPDSIARQLDWLFASDAREWRRWEANIRAISRPDAALQIARCVTGQAATA
jgi:processive 1,2-diacylglycerol beta-glucosyltransferase